MTTIDRRSAAAGTTAKPTTTTAIPTTPKAPPAADDDVEDFASVAPPRGQPEVDLEGSAGLVVTAHEAIGPRPPPRAPRSMFATAELAAAALQERFGVSLKGSWSLEALARVHETFMQLGPRERDAVRGLELRREVAPPAGSGEGGVTAGVFKHFDDIDAAGRPVGGASITFYDAAFPSSGDSGLDRQTSMSVVFHEVGHALEGHALSGPVGAQRGGAHVAHEVFAFEERLGPTHAAALTALRDFNDDAAVAPLIASVKAWSVGHEAIGNDDLPMADRQAAVVELQRTHARALALAGSLPAEHPARKAAADLLALNSAVTDLQPVYLAGVQRADDAAAAIHDRGGVPDHLQTEGNETLGALELQFHAMDEPTTDYGRTSPVEDFAEGYMLYKRAPSTLTPAARAFFQKHFPL